MRIKATEEDARSGSRIVKRIRANISQFVARNVVFNPTEFDEETMEYKTANEIVWKSLKTSRSLGNIVRDVINKRVGDPVLNVGRGGITRYAVKKVEDKKNKSKSASQVRNKAGKSKDGDGSGNSAQDDAMA